MSEPNRYTFEAREVLDANGMVCFVGVSTLTHPMGKYVSYEDYARLKAEVERLTKVCEVINAYQHHPSSPPTNTKIVPPYIPPPRKDSINAKKGGQP